MNDLLVDDVPVIITAQNHYSFVALKPNTIYHVKIQFITEQGDSLPSESTVFRTDDERK